MPNANDQLSKRHPVFSRCKACQSLHFALIFALARPIFAQVSAQPTSISQSSSQLPALKSNVRRVEVDVVVTDATGRPVTGLTQADFKVEEDNAPQSVRSFDVHTAAPEGSYSAPNLPSLSRNTFLNIQTAPEAGTQTVLLYDALNMSPGEQSYARQQLMQFIKHRRPGTQIAIFVLGTKLRLLQGFTENTDLLSAALATTNAKTHALALQGSSNPIVRTPGAMDGDLDPNSIRSFSQMLDDFARSDASNEGKLAALRWVASIKELKELARFLVSVPGRKSLIWLSSMFGFSREALDLFTLSHTAVYPVDIKGVRVNAAFSAATNAAYGPNGIRFAATPKRLWMEEDGTRGWMDSVAHATGGHAFYGTNDLQDAVDRAMKDGSTYYALTYEPTNPKYDGSLRVIKVSLKKSGYELAYRRTYYADDLTAAAHAVADAPESPLTPALERGTPLSHGLFIEAHLDADGPPALATPDQMQVLAQYGTMQGKKTVKVPPVLMQQYDISYGLVARQLDMPADETGSHQASLEFGVISYDDDGRKLNGADTHVEDTIPAARYAKIASDGYHVVQSVFVPVTAASIRLAVRDIRGNRVGSLEVKLPLAKAAKEETPR